MSEIERRALLGAVGAVGAAGLAAMARGAGPLSPPPGPVATTGKTLDQVEPRALINALPADVNGLRTVLSRGSKLTADLFGDVALVDQCDVDLSGFILSGTVSRQNAFSGRMRIGNGVLSGQVFAAAGAPANCLFEDVIFVNCAVFAGESCTFRRCRFDRAAVVTGTGCLVESCTMNVPFAPSAAAPALSLGARSILSCFTYIDFATVNAGIVAGEGCLLERCRIQSSVQTAVTAGEGCTLNDCAVQSSRVAFATGGRCTLLRCVTPSGVSQAGSMGFQLGDDNVVESCVAYFKETGFRCGENNVLRNCLAHSCLGDGFVCVGAGAGFDACTARGNEGRGFALVNSSRIERCLAVSNTQGGIVLTSDSLCRGNHCDSNGVVNLLVSSSDNRVESNSVVDGTVGIQVDGASNLIIGNSSASPTPYTIAAGNAAGPIVATANVATNTVSTANFSY